MTRGLAMAVATVGFVVTSGAQERMPGAGSQAPRADNYYAAGNRIAVTTAMAGDVVVAGREVEIVQPVEGDILAAGWRVALTARADDDVRVAGGEVRINAPVSGDLTIAGGDVMLGPNTHVNGRSWLTGKAVRIEGLFDRNLQVAGANVEIAGEIRQPVTIVAENLDIRPSARILAPLTYKGSTEPRIAQGAVVNGPITYEQIPQQEARRARTFPTVSTLLFSFHVFAAGLLVLIFLPRVETAVVATLRSQPGRSLLAGFVVLVTIPVAACVLILTVLGLPIGLALGASYAVSLFGAVIAAAFCVGDMEARLLKMGPVVSRGQHVLLLLAGVLTLALLRSLVGGVIVFASVLFGLGALTLSAYRAYALGSAPTAA